MSSPSTSPRPARADARRNRERVLEAARAAFGEQGLDVHMEEIARRAGLGVGTVYRHFPTKEALIEALWAAKRERMIELARTALDNPDPWAAVVEVFRRGLEMQAADLGWCAAFAGRPRGLTEADAPPDLVRSTNALLERARRAGVLRPDFGFDDVARVFCATGAVIATHGPGAGQELLRVVLDGMRAA